MIGKMVVHNATILRSLPNFVDPSLFLRDLCTFTHLTIAVQGSTFHLSQDLYYLLLKDTILIYV